MLNPKSLVLSAAVLAAQVSADCLNEVHPFRPNDRSMASNISEFAHSVHKALSNIVLAFMVVPINKNAVQQAVNEAYAAIPDKPQLQDIPADFGFAADMHPVLVGISLQNDVRQSDLALSGPLRGSSALVPFTSRRGDSTSYIAHLISYVASGDPSKDPLLGGAVPAVASTTLGGLPIGIAEFTPRHEAYQSDGTSGGEDLYSTSVKWAALPNQISGPGIYPAAYDMHFTTQTGTPRHSLPQLKAMINQPFILNAPFNILGTKSCQRNTYYLNNATAEVEFRTGNVTFGKSASKPGVIVSDTLQKASPDGVGNYYGVEGFSACTQLVGYNPVGGEDCAQAEADYERDGGAH